MILTYIESEDGSGSYQLLEGNLNKNPPEVEGRALHECGATHRPAYIFQNGAKQKVVLHHIKTTLFKTLLIIKAEAVALQMMIKTPNAKFTDNSDPLATPAIVLAVNKDLFLVAQKLVERPDFSLSDIDVDRHNGTRVTVLEQIAKKLTPDLVNVMAAREIDLSSPIKIYSHPSLAEATPLMLSAEFGNIDAVRALIPYVDVSRSVGSKASYALRRTW
ncbi:MAG: hypothetical protein V4485_00245 [Pseudomonadota bacterium]